MLIRGSSRVLRSVFLAFSIVLVAGTVTAFHYPPNNNVPPGPPSNYNQVDTTYVLGTPAIPIPPPDSGGYYIFRDSGKWNIVAHIYSKGSSLEQFHGSILAILAEPPQPGVNIFLEQLELWADTSSKECLKQNDRWGWVQWGENLYEIWWDFTTRQHKDDGSDINDILRLRIDGAAVDFNLWSSAHRDTFRPKEVYLGGQMVRLSSIPEFADSFEGVEDPYQSQAGEKPERDPNITIFTPRDLPGESYNALGLILPTDTYPCDGDNYKDDDHDEDNGKYGERYAGAFAYEGNGLQFSVLGSAIVNEPPQITCPDSLIFFACALDTFCFDVQATDPEMDKLTFRVVSGNAFNDSNTVCLISAGDEVLYVEIEVTDEAGNSESCIVTVIIIANSPPFLTVDVDQQVALCAPETLCFVASAEDFDPNLDTVWSNYGEITNDGRVCFLVDTAGFYSIKIFARDSCGAMAEDSFAVTATLNSPPVVSLGPDFSRELCAATSICLLVDVTDDNPAALTSNAAIIGDSVCFVADSSGEYVIWAKVTDDCGLVATDTAVVTITIPSGPTVEIGADINAAICEPTEFCIDVITIDGFHTISFNFLGIYDSLSGQFCFLADQSINDFLIVEVTDSCGQTARDSLAVYVQFNSSVTVDVPMPDTTVYLCQPSFVCLPLLFSDGGSNLADSRVTVNLGTYADSQVCFVPYDSGTYTIIATATDSCGNLVSDTAVVRVLTDQYVNLLCPNDTSIFMCTPETLCFPIGEIPEWAAIEVSGINVWYDSTTNQVCFFTDCGLRNRIVVSAITPCDTLTCEFTVDVVCNQAPVVLLPADTSFVYCMSDTIRLPVGISDPNGNLSRLILPDWVIYSPLSGQISFKPDTAGTYIISVTAIDSCGESGSDFMAVTVKLNASPTCVVPPDTSFSLCQPGQITLPVFAVDDNYSPVDCFVISGPGSVTNGQWTYQADSSVTATVVIMCINECANSCTDSFNIDIIVNEPPVCDLPNDTTLLLCEPSEICLPVSATDPNGHFVACSLVAGPGTIIDIRNPDAAQLWCYTPTSDTTFEVVIRCQDDCGAFCEDTFRVTVVMNDPPTATCPGDVSMLLCDLSEAYLTGFSASDPDGEVPSISVAGGRLAGDTVFFTPVVGENFITLIATDSCGLADTCQTLVLVDTNTAPVCLVPNDTTFTGCVTDLVCLPVTGFDADGNLASCEIISGPGLLENGLWCYSPQANDTVTVTIRCTDSCGAWCESSFTVIFDAGAPPLMENQFYSAVYCSDILERTISVEASNDLSDPTVFELFSGIGAIDSISGLLTYLPDTSGVYSFAVSASNSCGSSSATVYDTVSINRPPELTGFDSTVYLCQVQEICFNVIGFDPDNDSLEILQVQDSGQFTQLTATSGQTCFTPEEVDSATYLFVYQVSDLCQDAPNDTIAVYFGTVTITVILNQAPSLSYPMPLNLFACSADTVCFEVIPSDPDGDPVSVDIVAGNASVVDGVVCLSVDTAGVYEVGVKASDTCGNSATYTIEVNVTMNNPPQVIADDDFSVVGCSEQEICFGISASDIDNNLDLVLASYGLPVGSDSICFLADTSGLYSIIVTAVDSCGAQSADTVNVTVNLNSPPVVNLGSDLARELCLGDSLCLSFEVADDNLASISSNFVLDGDSVCFAADSSGTYTIWVEAIDSCGLATTDTLLVTVTVPPAPFVELGDDLRAFICEPTEFCIDVQTIDNYASITFNQVGYDPATRKFCWTVENTILDMLTVEVIDSCGRVAVDSLPVNIQFNSSPVVETPMLDTTVYLCQPSFVCLPLQFSDAEGSIADSQVTVNLGNYANGEVCYVPYDSGTYTIIATATDSCGSIVSDTAIVVVLTDQLVNLQCPDDTSVFMCTPETLCFPIGEIPEWASIEVSGINVWYDSTTNQVCFFTDCGLRNRIVVSAITPCDTLSCEFTVDVVCNQAPVVLLPPDTTLVLCGPDTLYIPVGINDQDGNLESVITDGWVYFEPVSSRLSFAADTEGVYVLQVTAVDSCGAETYDQVSVTVLSNTPPIISFAPFDSVFSVCSLEEICLPLNIADGENNVIQVTPSLGRYDELNRQICFIPSDSFGVYCINVIAIDSCDLADTTSTCVTIINEGVVSIDCPVDTAAISLCGADSICKDISVVGTPDSVEASFGQYAGGQLCFMADTSGFYEIDLTVFSPCTTLTCVVYFDVTISDSVYIICPPDDSVSLCGPDTIYYAFAMSMSVESVVASSPAFVFGNRVGVPVITAGTYDIILIASGQCGADTCGFTVQAGLNSPPEVVSAPDTVLNDCVIPELCIPFTVTDPDNNIDSVVGPEGPITGSEYCFTPSSLGTHRIIITAYDACGAIGVDTTVVQVTRTDANITCPTGQQTRTVCRGDSVKVVVPVTPFEATVSVFLDGQPNGTYNRDMAEVSVLPADSGLHTVRIIAQASCNADTCEFALLVHFNEPPIISCPAVVDTFVCLIDVDSVCIPVSVTGTNVLVSVSPVGRYDTGFVCVPVAQEGSLDIMIAAIGDCGVDSCMTTLNVTVDQPPVLIVPADTIIQQCDFDTGLICISGISVTDELLVSLNKTCGPGTLDLIRVDSGQICFKPDSQVFGTYVFCIEADDGCNIVRDSFSVEIREAPECTRCITLTVDGGECVYPGRSTKVQLDIETFRPIGAFNILISFDATVMAFTSASIAGTAIDGWEVFTYRLNNGACQPACPSGIVRLVGLADDNNGADHPPVETLTPNGVLVDLFFQVTNNQNIAGQFLPVNFVTYDCSNNSFGDPSGNELYYDNKIFNAESLLVWDESDDIFYPEGNRPFGMGTADSCVVENLPTSPTRCVEFTNGGVCVLPTITLGNRGDINLNSVPYEVADAVVFTNYFIYGLSAFTVDVPLQIATTDINGDGITLSVADLVLLLRIILGDSDPIPKLNPHETELLLTGSLKGTDFTLTVESVNGIGGAYLVYKLESNTDIGTPELSNAARQMDLKYDVVDDELRILIFSMTGNTLPAGVQELVSIPYSGQSAPSTLKAEFADGEGRPYTTLAKTVELPTDFALYQNYPNPFNPATKLSFYLAVDTDWKMTIYNVKGEIVKQFSGNNATGMVELIWDGRTANGNSVASGVYFYRLEAMKFVDTKKMIMLK